MLKKYKWNDGPWLIADGSPESSITICWTTAQKKDSLLLWGKSKLNLCNIQKSKKGKFHGVVINNLLPDTTYYYSVQDKLILFNDKTIFSFKTQCTSNSDKSVEFIIAGDLQPKNKYTLQTNYNMAKQINSENPDFLVQTGDLVQIGSLSGYWHMLMKSFPYMASFRPVFPVVGNHEYYLFHKNSNFRLFFPFNFQNKKGCYHSKNIGNIHISFLDPYDNGFAGLSSNISKKQKNWFVKDLEKSVRDGVKWIFVVLHQAVLSNGEYPGDIKLQKWILPILSKFNVDAVFWGHAHLYEHWRYQYGENGFVINPEDNSCRNTIDFFCAGSSGASLESNYRLFTHKPFKHKKIKWFNKNEGVKETRTTIQYPWNREIYLERKMDIKKSGIKDFHYYHYPLESAGKYSDTTSVSYNTENKWFGYMYGENTLHYVKVKVKDKNCTISVHYPDGTLLTGPDGLLPQKFLLKQKNRGFI